MTVGKNADRKIEELVARYCDRLKHYVKFEIVALPDCKITKGLSSAQQKSLEGQSILSAIKQNACVILLDEKGEQLTSLKFADMLNRHLVGDSRDIVFVVGGPYGFSQEVYARADKLLSLSKMTLTHEMVRLFFVEQLYRAFTIIRGESYHHE